MKINLAVTGLNASDSPGPGLGIIKCLRAQTRFDVRIIGLAYDAKEATIYVENACDEVYLIPYPSAGVEAFKSRMREVVQRAKVNFFLPALDSELANALAMEAELKSLGVRTFLPTAEMIEMRSKLKLQELCRKARLRYPQTIEISNYDQLFAGARRLGYPCVVKGIFYEAVIARNDADLDKAARAISFRWGFPLLLQQHVPGEEFDIAIAGDGEGRMIGITAMKKMALTDKGKAWGGMTIQSPGLFACCRRLMKHLEWRGPMEAEIMRCEKTDQYYLIEINPRFPAWIYLSHGAGCNLPELLLQHLYEKNRSRSSTVFARPGTLFLRYAQDMIISMPEYESMLMSGELRRGAPTVIESTARVTRRRSTPGTPAETSIRTRKKEARS
ncbi:MAG TPA: ATP-grasp domain-containing protein [Candidatus Ozemobacteraceae bacterium]|nr:ATP-grasp domain-containing protein [Candidatus Ozemobacteraceae bacterium]